MLEPRSIAIVGASARPDSFGERLSIEALRSPAAPRVHLVHPAYDAVLGEPCLPSLEAVEGPVDLVLLGVPDSALVEQVARARERGDGGAVVFGSAVGLAGPLRQAAGPMPLVGGGCMGFLNVAKGVRALGYLEQVDNPTGPIALVTHSGSAFSALLRTHRRLEYSFAVSSGQELVTGTADYLDYALSLPQTRVVGLFLETMRDVPRLRAALARAAEQDVPVVALTVGASLVGRHFVGAHSGALAGADASWEALFRAYGVHRVEDLDELVDTLELLSLVHQKRPRRRHNPRGLALVHDSGGERALAADLAERVGVDFAALSAESTAALAGLLDDGLAVSNPLDVWGNGAETEVLLTTCLTTLAADPEVALTALSVDLVEEYDGDDSYWRSVLTAAENATRAGHGPVAVLTPMASAVHQPTAAMLRGAGVPVLEGLSSGLRAVRHLLAPRPAPPSAARPTLMHLPDTDQAWHALLRSYGIPIIETRNARSAAEVVARAEQLGFPVALKTAAADHKTEVDGVRLGLVDANAVRAGYDDLAARLGPDVLVQPMAAPGVEIALGIVRDPHLGPLVVLGVGGSLVELVGERVVALPPFDEPTALALVDGLPRVSRLLDGVRGAPSVDRTALASTVSGMSRLASAVGERMEAVEVNPLVCSPAGIVGVDLLVVPAPGVAGWRSRS